MPIEIVYDSDFVTATEDGAPQYFAPIPGVAAQYVFAQAYVQKQANFAAITIGTVHPSLPTFYLMEESPHEHRAAGIIRWARTYAQVPATHSEHTTISYDFIGYFGTWGPDVVAVTGRQRRAKSVNCRMAFEYFRTGAGTSYATAANIPVISAQTYRYGVNDVDHLGDSPPLDVATTPTLTAYKAMVVAGTEIVAAMSSIERWMGNIYVRKTPYVVAQ